MKTIDELGLEIRRLREAAGLSQMKAASLIGVTQWGLGRWELGATVPKVESLRKIAKVLPLEVEVWEPIVAEHHRHYRKSVVMKDVPQSDRLEVDAMIRRKPVKRLKTKRSPISEIVRAARAEGLTYGEYIARHGL